MVNVQHHFLLLAYSVQGHLNPALRLAHRLINMGAMVTLSTPLHTPPRVDHSLATLPGLSFAPFPHQDNHRDFVANLIASSSHPFTCILHTMLFFPWAPDLARQLHLPSALLWVQPATLLSIFHHYFKDNNLIKNKLDDVKNSSNLIIELPGLPPLKTSELPTLITSPRGEYSFVKPLLGEVLRAMQQQPNPMVLVNTLDELEPEALKALHDCFRTIAIGPLVPSILFEENGETKEQPLDSGNDDYIEWLTSKEESSVIYISFGSLTVLSKRQMEEIERGLIESGRPFLWSIREEKEEEKVKELREEMEEKGKVVTWCDQVKILSHKSVGCFVCHCGCSSILESLVAGVPVVGIPQFADQPTNAKLVEDVWKSGVRATVENGGDGEGIVRGEEIRRRVEEVMGDGEKGKAVRENVLKWREVSREAVKVGGSSHANLKAFLDQLG